MISYARVQSAPSKRPAQKNNLSSQDLCCTGTKTLIKHDRSDLKPNDQPLGACTLYGSTGPTKRICAFNCARRRSMRALITLCLAPSSAPSIWLVPSCSALTYSRVLRCSWDRSGSGGETDTGKIGFDCVWVNRLDWLLPVVVDDDESSEDDQRRWFW